MLKAPFIWFSNLLVIVKLFENVEKTSFTKYLNPPKILTRPNFGKIFMRLGNWEPKTTCMHWMNHISKRDKKEKRIARAKKSSLLDDFGPVNQIYVLLKCFFCQASPSLYGWFWLPNKLLSIFLFFLWAGFGGLVNLKWHEGVCCTV